MIEGLANALQGARAGWLKCLTMTPGLPATRTRLAARGVRYFFSTSQMFPVEDRVAVVLELDGTGLGAFLAPGRGGGFPSFPNSVWEYRFWRNSVSRGGSVWQDSL